MISKAKASFIRISPRKVRYVIDLIRTKSVPQARAILSITPRRAGEIVHKLLNSAVDAAVKNSQVEADMLVVSKIYADGGSTMKRFRAMSMGRAGVIRKRTSHIYLELDLAKGKTLPPAVKGSAKAAKTKSEPTDKGAMKASSKSGLKKLVGAK